MVSNYLARQPREYDKEKLLAGINIEECTPPTRRKILKIARKKKPLTIDEQIYLAAVHDFMKIDQEKREVIKRNMRNGDVKLRLERESEDRRKRNTQMLAK